MVRKTVIRIASTFFLLVSLIMLLKLESTVVNAQEEDSTPPTGSVLINNGEEYTTSTSVILTLTANDPESGVSAVRYSNDGVWNSERWEEPSSTKSWDLESGDGVKIVYYQIMNAAGLESDTYSDTIILDTASPTGSITINGGDEFTSSNSVILTLTADDATSGVSQVSYSNDGVWDSESWEIFSETKSWTLTSGDGTKTVYYQIRDKAGLASSVYSDSISLSTTGPSGSIVINGGDDFTTSRSVTLSLTYEDSVWGVYQVRYSNYGAWNSEKWESPVDTRSWNLLVGDGTKTVYYQIINTAGLESDTYSDTIILDTTAPTGSILINGGDAFTASVSVSLTLTASDQTSGVSEVRYSNTGEWGSELDGWERFSPSKSWTLTSGDGPKTVYYQIRDNAGLRSSVFSDTIYLSTAIPTGSIVINSGGNYTTTRSVTLTLNYTAPVSGVSAVRYSNDGVWNSERWEEPSSTKSWDLESGDGIKTVYYQIRNSAGLVSDTYSDTIILDTAEPTGSIIIADGDATTPTTTVALSLTVNDTTSDVSQVRFSNDGTWDTETWEGFSPTRSWTLTSGDGNKTVYYQIRDNAGLTSEIYSDSIILESPPTPTSTPTSNPTPTPSTTPSPTMTPTTAPTPTPTPIPSSTPYPTDYGGGAIPPEAFYATVAAGSLSIAAIAIVTFRKPKNSKNTKPELLAE